MEVFGGTHGIIMTFLIGLVVGIIAKFLTPGRDPSGFIITAIIGIIGSFAATWIGRTLGWYQAGESAGWIASIIGAIVLLLIHRMFTKRSTTP
jgi:uncharacterized membrane protein YeaQ/YmgE (transglycosylase-associated protein family)